MTAQLTVPLAALLAVMVTSILSAGEKPLPVPTDHAQRMTLGLELFKKDVGALLTKHCLDCHGGEKTKGGFDLATREGLLEGGVEGDAIVVGDSKASRLLKLLRHEEEPHMPSKKPRLSDDDIARIAAWIDAGAPYDQSLIANAKPVKDRSVVSDQDKQFWSFQPLGRAALPAVKQRNWARTPIDQFILAKLEDQKLSPNTIAAKRTLIRRAYFDLIGLPPKPEEVESFVADHSAQTYEQVIDHLLASPHYGERWGRHWLDLARFAESHGYEQDYDRAYAYHYRDFVIRALNNDLPFDTFVKWQIAGDELAPDNPEAWFATGFLGAGTHATQITANQAEKERYDELDDTIATIGTAMLGLTIGCARCHDHKYDPIPTEDYYRLLSTFTTTVRSDHDVDLNPAQTRAALAKWDTEHEPLAAALAAFEKEKLPARSDAWLRLDPILPQPAWLWLPLEGVKVAGTLSIGRATAQPDGSWLINVAAGSPDTMVFTTKTNVTDIRALRLEALADPTLPNYGPGWASDGGFNLVEFNVSAKPLTGGGESIVLKFVRRIAATGDAPTNEILPWARRNQSGRDQTAVFELAQPVGFEVGTELSVTLKFSRAPDRALIGRLRLSVGREPNDDVQHAPVAAREFTQARALLQQPREKWTPAERKTVQSIYRYKDEEWRQLNDAVIAHRAAKPKPTRVKAMVCSEGLPAIRLNTQGPDFYESTFLLRRGDLAQKRGEAAPGFIQALMRAPEKENHWQQPKPSDARTPFRRAALAHWLTDAEQGAGHLLARVIVNRLWQHHFGRGLVTTASDFGATGEPPTHPELLDWLAGELIKNGWQLKPMHKLIMTSAVYMQGGDTDETRMKADPENRLWSYRSPVRLEAEIIRDAILSVSGRLDPTMFGPGSLDESMRRRSIYFFLKRSQLIPMLVQFDAPDTLQGVGRRMNTTVAPQALLLMNNAEVRAAAHDFASRLKPAAATSRSLAIQTAYALALARAPTTSEISDAVAFLEEQSQSYGRPDAADLAMADFCHVIFALNEFVYVK